MAISFSLDDIGLQTLVVKGVSFLSGALLSTDSVMGAAVWRSSGNVETVVDRPNISEATAKSHGAAYAEHSYGSGLRTCTLRFTYTAVDFRTLKVNVKLTNTSVSETIARADVFPLGYFYRSFQIPGSSSATRPGSQIVHIGSIGGSEGDEQGATPVHLFQGTWGHCAVWANVLGNNQCLQIPWTDSAGQTLFNPRLRNYSIRHGDTLTVNYEDVIAPGATWEYDFYMRFGASPTASYRTITQGAAVAVERAFPFLNKWATRTPIARAFLCSANESSVTNPRGYWDDHTIDVSDSAGFLTKTTTFANACVTRMNAMSPRPQGIIIWDLEGNPNDASVYRGAPHLIATLSPEMDLAADAFFNVFTAAGYYVGMTLRADTLVLTGGVWRHHPGFTEDDAVTALSTRVSYAQSRWGSLVRLFYIDSAYIDMDQDGVGDVLMPFNVWRRLQRAFPDVLFIPEQENTYCYGASAPYNELQGGITGTPQIARDVYRRAFSVLNLSGGDTTANHAALLDSVIKGDVLMVDGDRSTATNTTVQALYAEAGL